MADTKRAVNEKAQGDLQHVELHPDNPGTLTDVGQDAISSKPTEFAEQQLKSELDRLPLMKAVTTFRRAFWICAIAGFTASTDGYQFQISGAILANRGFISHISNGQYANADGVEALDPNWVSVFNGIFSAGQVIGQFGAQYISEWIGRRYAIFAIMGVLLVAIVIEATNPLGSWGAWSAGKLVAGTGIGAVQATLPVYINEHSPAQIRGFLVVAYSLWWSVGGLFANVVLKVRSDQAPQDWRTSVYTQFAMVGLSVIIFIFLPESPWWAVRHNKIDLARKVLTRTYKDVEGYHVERELGILIHTVEVQRQHDAATKLLGPFAIFKGLNGKRFLIGSWPKVLQQFVGLAVFSSNAAYFFQIAGNRDPFMVTLILAITSLGAVGVDALLVDKIGRRWMTIIGFGGACIGMVVIAITSLFQYEGNSALGALLVFGGVFASFFNTFQSSTSYAYLTEMPEQRFKARACGWGLAYCNLYAVLINFTLPLMLKAWKVRAAWFFVCLGVPGTVLAYFIMPESMRRSPAEIQEMFVDRVPLRKWKGYKTAVERDMEVRTQQQNY